MSPFSLLSKAFGAHQLPVRLISLRQQPLWPVRVAEANRNKSLGAK